MSLNVKGALCWGTSCLPVGVIKVTDPCKMLPCIHDHIFLKQGQLFSQALVVKLCILVYWGTCKACQRFWVGWQAADLKHSSLFTSVPVSKAILMVHDSCLSRVNVFLVFVVSSLWVNLVSRRGQLDHHPLVNSEDQTNLWLKTWAALWPDRSWPSQHRVPSR